MAKKPITAHGNFQETTTDGLVVTDTTLSGTKEGVTGGIKVYVAGQADGVGANPYVTPVQVGTDLTAAWANSDPANTAKTVNVAAPTNMYSEYAITVYNPSTETSLTCVVYATETALNAASRDSEVATFTFSANKTMTKFVSGMFLGSTAKIIFSNDSAVGVAGAFTAYVRIRCYK